LLVRTFARGLLPLLTELFHELVTEMAELPSNSRNDNPHKSILISEILTEHCVISTMTYGLRYATIFEEGIKSAFCCSEQAVVEIMVAPMRGTFHAPSSSRTSSSSAAVGDLLVVFDIILYVCGW
jgi:hypothetical protein